MSHSGTLNLVVCFVISNIFTINILKCLCVCVCVQSAASSLQGFLCCSSSSSAWRPSSSSLSPPSCSVHRSTQSAMTRRSVLMTPRSFCVQKSYFRKRWLKVRAELFLGFQFKYSSLGWWVFLAKKEKLMVSVVNFKSSTVNLVSYLFFWSSRRRSNVLKTRSPRGNAMYDGMEWKLCSGVRPRCCGVIPSLVYVCGACYCWPKAAAVDQSSPSDENGSIELIWSQICFLLGRALDGPLLPESVTGGLGGGETGWNPGGSSTTRGWDVNLSPSVCTNVLDNWDVVVVF